MNAVAAWIAKIGEDTRFVVFCAHCFFAYFVLSLFSGTHQYIAAAVFIVLIAAKEFWFDIKYEQNPPQTFWDSADDFIGYAFGVALAITLPIFHI
jgi:hypothetical protein